MAREQARAIADLEERLAEHRPAAASVRDAHASTRDAPVAAAPAGGGAGDRAAAGAGSEKKPAPECWRSRRSRWRRFPGRNGGCAAERRDAARAAAADRRRAPAPDRNSRARWLAIGGAVAGGAVPVHRADPGQGAVAHGGRDGVGHRQVASGGLARTVALADAGDARAQARLALAYLRGQGVTSDPAAALRWSAVARQGGRAGGAISAGRAVQQGDVKPIRRWPFGWFASAAAKGNLKAMHNLAIAYAQGLGTRRTKPRRRNGSPAPPNAAMSTAPSTWRCCMSAAPA